MYPSYGYDLYIPSLAASLGFEHRSESHGAATTVLADAAWHFVQRGLLRPGVRQFGLQTVEDGASFGFSITQAGRRWLQKHPLAETRIEDAEGLNAFFRKYGARFGDAFTVLAQEAAGCYHDQRFAASCVMASTAGSNMVGQVLRAQGHMQQEQQVPTGVALKDALQRLNPSLRQRLEVGVGPLLGTVEQATRGELGLLGQEDAYVALMQLVDGTKFVNEHWQALTASDAQV